jgi:hypothetical protein
MKESALGLSWARTSCLALAAATTALMSAAFFDIDFLMGTPKAWRTMLIPALEKTSSSEAGTDLKLVAEPLTWKITSHEGTLRENTSTDASQSISSGVATSPSPDRATAHGSGASRLEPRSAKWCKMMMACQFDVTPTTNKCECANHLKRDHYVLRCTCALIFKISFQTFQV